MVQVRIALKLKLRMICFKRRKSVPVLESLSQLIHPTRESVPVEELAVELSECCAQAKRRVLGKPRRAVLFAQFRDAVHQVAGGKVAEAADIIQIGNHLLFCRMQPQLFPSIRHLDSVDEFHAGVVEHARSHLEALKRVGIAADGKRAGEVLLSLLGQQADLVKVFPVGAIQRNAVW